MDHYERFPLISIVLPSWNSIADITDLLSSIDAQIYPKSAMEIIIVDNGSKDGSAEVIQQWYDAHQSGGWHLLKTVALSQNKGIAVAYDIAYENCSPESFAILRVESDIILSPDLIAVMVRTLVESPEVGIIGAKGLLYDAPGRIDHAARNMDWWTGNLHDFDSNEKIDCDCIYGATFIIRRLCIEQIGFFFDRDRFFASELELCTRIKRRGYRVLYEPKAICYHKFSKSTQRAEQRKLHYLDRKEFTLFQLSYIPFPGKVLNLAYSFAFCVKQALKCNRMHLRGFLDGIITGILHFRVQLAGIQSVASPLGAEWLIEPEISAGCPERRSVIDHE